ncbi:apolipoprotein N-acyltransferase [Tunturibacter empetritectus]|uniref:Apolipoprotein N-acyltransferase n=2 Tax=Tunturiibacter empetritectus TaxID=3069691 RepID=A0A7W8IFH8_9BACT|nr:apolipoprotein N-acyltransferase [Edaphobacter lichenicola]MBB5316262.1 apolipoprotein N-acyltransferase [Edaphobacter lichenicola]
MRLIPLRLWAMAVLSGILQVLPFPIAGPVPVWRTTFCWIALLPLLWATLANDKNNNPLTIRQGAAIGYLCGFLWYMGNCYWIYQTMYLYGGLAKPIAAGILILFCLYLGLYHALFGAILAAFRSHFGRQSALVFVPFAWVAVELARARITGLPWDLLGIAQVDNPLLTRLAPITGAYGLSFVIAAVNALWLVRIRLRERRYTRPALTIAGVLIIVVYILGLRLIANPKPTSTTATATLVQENLEVGAANTGPQPTTQQFLDSFSYLSRHPSRRFLLGTPELRDTQTLYLVRPRDEEESDANPPIATNLIVWPESPAPFEDIDPQFRNAMSALARSAQAPVIVGNIGFEPSPTNKSGYTPYNRASFINADGTFDGHYDKMHLVPFGEYVPFKDLFFFAKNLLNEVGTFAPGAQRTVFSTGGHTYGVFICYESIFGDEIRQLSQHGADVLINISNDGWYGDTSAAWQHLNMVRMRAIENHRWVLRATNTGVTASINPYGHVITALPRHLRSSLRVHFGYEHDLTFYAAHGDLFAYACAFLTTLALGYCLGRRTSAGTL